jgi:hypothetical protein
MLLPIRGSHVAVIMAAMVAPAGVRSIAMMRACLVSDRVAVFREAGVERADDLGLVLFRAALRALAFDFDLGLVMGSSEVFATPSAAPPQPRPSNHPAGRNPGATKVAPSHHSNAPITYESQSILSNIVARMSFRTGSSNPLRSRNNEIAGGASSASLGCWADCRCRSRPWDDELDQC